MEIIFTCAYCNTVHFEALSHCLSCGAPYSQLLPPNKRLKTNEIIESIQNICLAYKKNSKFYWFNQISEKRLKRVVKGYGIQDEENIIIYFDNTILGVNVDGVVICKNGIYWRNPDYIDPSQNFLSWSEFKKRKLTSNSEQYNIGLEKGDVICVYGSQLLSLVNQLLEEIQSLLIQNDFQQETEQDL